MTKFTYLLSLLQGEAKDVVKGLTLTDDHYNVAVELLTQRYGCKELIVFNHIQSLLSLEAVGKGCRDSNHVKIKSQSTFAAWRHTRLMVRCLVSS